MSAMETPEIHLTVKAIVAIAQGCKLAGF